MSSQLFYSSCQLSCLDRSVVVSQEVLMVVVSGDFFVASNSRSCVLVLSAVSVCSSFSCRSGRFHFWNRAVAQFLGPLFFFQRWTNSFSCNKLCSNDLAALQKKKLLKAEANVYTVGETEVQSEI